jgi:hypothetical protein
MHEPAHASQHPPRNQLPLPLRVLLIHALGYFRWTQILPMLVVWGSIWTILGLFAFVNFQEQGLSIGTAAVEFAERVGFKPNFADAPVNTGDGSFGASGETTASDGTLAGLGSTGEDGAFLFGDEDVKKIILAYWGTVSFGLYVLAVVGQRLFGLRPRRTLRRKLLVAAGFAVGTWLAFFAIFFTTSETVHGSIAQWILVFSVLSLLPLLVSLYSLTIAHGIDLTIAGLRDDGPTTEAST